MRIGAFLKPRPWRLLGVNILTSLVIMTRRDTQA